MFFLEDRVHIWNGRKVRDFTQLSINVLCGVYMTLYVLLYICKGKAFSYKIRIELKFEKKYTTLLLYNHMIDNCFFIFVRSIAIVHFCPGTRFARGGRYIINHIHECYCYPPTQQGWTFLYLTLYYCFILGIYFRKILKTRERW